mmetsp:Transcript_142014/g.360643  ORF Transcript_142014/g.360643 Transcript_142014/m.360643 type:complete len:342 (-) Transcript_142014:748-1773(-)
MQEDLHIRALVRICPKKHGAINNELMALLQDAHLIPQPDATHRRVQAGAPPPGPAGLQAEHVLVGGQAEEQDCDAPSVVLPHGHPDVLHAARDASLEAAPLDPIAPGRDDGHGEDPVDEAGHLQAQEEELLVSARQPDSKMSKINLEPRALRDVAPAAEGGFDHGLHLPPPLEAAAHEGAPGREHLPGDELQPDPLEVRPDALDLPRAPRGVGVDGRQAPLVLAPDGRGLRKHLPLAEGELDDAALEHLADRGAELADEPRAAALDAGDALRGGAVAEQGLVDLAPRLPSKPHHLLSGALVPRVQHRQHRGRPSGGQRLHLAVVVVAHEPQLARVFAVGLG